MTDDHGDFFWLASNDAVRRQTRRRQKSRRNAGLRPMITAISSGLRSNDAVRPPNAHAARNRVGVLAYD